MNSGDDSCSDCKMLNTPANEVVPKAEVVSSILGLYGVKMELIRRFFGSLSNISSTGPRRKLFLPI